ncbi:aminopeptidase N C-terminal domain-containing protein, partial [Gilvimarinus sp. 1_MG-2023]|uniref:aminopeptidase N C-terminal domain-containing protein n=1 Tax=Gilvimarinus sp. 1_MG-2023 TaxID=3062638 RepID=UPI0026E2FE6F
GDDELAQQSLEAFYQQWQNDALVVNQWLSVQAGSADLGTLNRIQQLLEHEAFDWRNPNKILSVIGAFANQALCHFHAQDGSGYRLLA